MISILSFLFLFTLIALAHEGAHFFAAKISGIKVYEFAIGFGPKLFSFKRGGTIYSLNSIPIAAYVRLAGMHPSEAEDEAARHVNDSQKFSEKNPSIKLFVLSLGGLSNIFFGFLVFLMLAYFVGSPAGITNIVDSVMANSPASKIGLLPGDKIININSLPINSGNMEKAVNIIHSSPNSLLHIDINRNGEIISYKVSPVLDKKLNFGVIGFRPRVSFTRLSLVESINRSFSYCLNIISSLLQGIYLLASGKVSFLQILGPIGIANMSGKFASLGYYSFFNFLAFFSINVGILNLLPIPALDGGRIVFAMIELISRRKISLLFEYRFHQAGLFFLLFIFLIISMNDIFRLITH